jgi:hypothetical protein
MKTFIQFPSAVTDPKNIWKKDWILSTFKTHLLQPSKQPRELPLFSHHKSNKYETGGRSIQLS